MDGKDAIIKRILNDAADKAREMENSAKEKASEKQREAKKWADEYIKSQTPALKKEAEEIVKRRITVADLEVRKILLAKKREAVDVVFSDAFKKLKTLNKEDYLKLVDRLISEYAESGDEVVLSRDGVLDKKDVESLGAVKEKGLKVRNSKGGFDGGVMLIGKVCDKDLTFGAIINGEKDVLISKIAEKLFS